MPRPTLAVSNSTSTLPEKTESAIAELRGLVEAVEQNLADFKDINQSTRALERSEKAVTQWIRDIDREFANRLRDVTHAESVLHAECAKTEKKIDELNSLALEWKLQNANFSGTDSPEARVAQLEDLREKQKNFVQGLAEIREERRAIAKNVAKLDHYSTKEIEVMKATVATFMSVTQLKWTENSSTRIRGSFLPHKNVKHVKNFDLPNDEDPVKTAETLWQEIYAFSVPPELQ
eukprot:GHVN01007813.1.p1 GENE.GHVN01007813.1~~GHVN01007813.1.p1  ORF type:complete len:234 (+),score=23.87 GHVN01007813.1:105-806(+)